MSKRRWLVAVVGLVCAVGSADAQELAADHIDKIQKAIDAALQGKKFTLRVRAEGDFNSDGINDLAVVVAANRPTGPREERLLVLGGSADGSYSPLSISGEFCGVNKFYNLSTSPAGNSFNVEGFDSAEPSHSSSFTLKFKYSARLNDFELVGREESSINYDEGSSYRVSINYLTRVAIQTRHLGRGYIERRTTPDGTERIVEHSRRAGKHKQVKTGFSSSALFRLHGFDCSSYWAEDPAASLPSRIDENFKIQKK